MAENNKKEESKSYSADKGYSEKKAHGSFFLQEKIWLLYAGIVAAIALLAIDLYRDAELHNRVTELEREVQVYKEELLKEVFKEDIEENQKILDCLKLKKYWEYGDCFR